MPRLAGGSGNRCLYVARGGVDVRVVVEPSSERRDGELRTVRRGFGNHGSLVTTLVLSRCFASAILAIRPRLVIRVGGQATSQRTSFSYHGRTFLCTRDRLYFASPGVAFRSA